MGKEFFGIVDGRHARLIGAIDLVIAAGLLTARPRWPWLTARYLQGKTAEAAAVVPDDLARAISLIGPPVEVKARLAALRAVGVTCVMANSVASTHRERVAQMEQLKDLLD